MNNILIHHTWSTWRTWRRGSWSSRVNFICVVIVVLSFIRRGWGWGRRIWRSELWGIVIYFSCFCGSLWGRWMSSPFFFPIIIIVSTGIIFIFIIVTPNYELWTVSLWFYHPPTLCCLCVVVHLILLSSWCCRRVAWGGFYENICVPPTLRNLFFCFFFFLFTVS